MSNYYRAENEDFGSNTESKQCKHLMNPETCISCEDEMNTEKREKDLIKEEKMITQKMLKDIARLKKEKKMGAVKNRMMDFLEEGGRELDYDEWNMPNIEDYDVILSNRIPLWEYKGYASEKDFYSK